MTAVIVLGMHRSGTSLVASMLEAMGVDMGERLMPASLDNPHGYYEDLDFYEMNEAILEEAGGSWWRPPSAQAIEAAGEALKYPIGRLVNERDWKKLWGWKDPRTCLTAGLYHSHLDDARYVVVRRDRPAIIASLLKRNGGQLEEWKALCAEYERRVVRFLLSAGAPVHHIRYEDVTHPKTGAWEALKLARFLGLDRYAAARAVDRIQYRDSWGFGSIGFGVPIWKMCPEFWLSWSWFLLNGLEEDDRFLNRYGPETKMPLQAVMPKMHNSLIRMFLESGCDTFCIIEDDHVFPYYQLHNLRHKPENQRFDIVCASYVRRTRTDIPLPMGWNIRHNAEEPFTCWFYLDDVAETGTQQYDGAAFGFTLIRRWVLEQMAAGQDLETYEWAGSEVLSTPDVPFYFKATELGARTGVDRDNRIDHVGTYNYTIKDFREWHREWKQNQKEQMEAS